MRLVIIGRCGVAEGNGPANVLRELVVSFQAMGQDIVPILYSSDSSKIILSFKVIKTILNEKNVAINVHTNGFLLPLLVYITSKLNKHNKYFLTIHGIYKIDSAINGSQKGVYCVLERLLYTKFSNLICVSQMLRESIANEFHRTKNVYVIPNATNASSKCNYQPDQRCTSFVLLGGLKKIKGIDKSLELLKYLKVQKKLKIHAIIYGGQEKTRNVAWLNATLKKLDLVGDVEYRGITTNKQVVYDCLATSDFQLCLSTYDTFNVAIAESLLIGCPCIATRTCGAAYLIEQGVTGLVIDEWEESALDLIYDYIRKLKCNPNLRKQLVEQVPKYQHMLSWESVCKEYLRISEEGIYA